MSEIDTYKHDCIGFVECPSRYKITHHNNDQQSIPLYILNEDGLNGRSWQAKRGDLLLGGGAGESAALRISMPESIYFFTNLDWDDYDTLEEIFCAYWSMNEAFVFCDGYLRLGWSPKERIEIWLTEHILTFIRREYPDLFNPWAGSVSLDKDGSIVRLPTREERALGKLNHLHP